MITPFIFISKLIQIFSKLFQIGHGGTWPGEIALRLQPSILPLFTDQVRKGIIVVAGTNGKTTTSKLITEILVQKEGGMRTIIHNSSGANLLNGLVSAFIGHANLIGKVDADWAVLEVDENTLPSVISQLNGKKVTVVLLNLFRDQLDRYGEVDSIAVRWEKALAGLSSESTLILNADDPQIAFLGKGKKAKIIYIGIDKKEKFLSVAEHATDSTYCRNCGRKLKYEGIYFSHVGIWYCPGCGNKRPKIERLQWNSNLVGLYNEYNVLAAAAGAKQLNISKADIETALQKFIPAFGRQEEIDIEGKKVKLFLAKNPAGFNASLRTVIESGARQILFVLNDRIPDGRDVSWIWDVDFEMLPGYVTPIVSGDRAYDMALRLKYSRQVYRLPNGAVSQVQTSILVYEQIEDALNFCTKGLTKDEMLYILPTYSAMLEVRKILTGRKIL